MAELFRRQQASQVNIPEIKPSTGGIETLRESAQNAKKISDEMKDTSMKLFSLELETTATTDLNMIFQNNKQDPDKLSKEIKSYQDGVEKKIPSVMLPQMRQRFMTMSQSLVSKALVNKGKVLDGQLDLARENNKNQLLHDINENSQNLINLDPTISDEKKQLLATNSFNAIAKSFESLRNNLSMTKSDGTMFNTPHQQTTVINTAKNQMMESTAVNWLNKSPNKIDAYNSWINGKVNITILDENNKQININIRDSFSPEIARKVDSKLRSILRDDVRIQNLGLKQQQALEKAHGEEVLRDLTLKLHGGELTEEEIVSKSGSIPVSEFKTLIKSVASVEGFTDKEVYANFLGQMRLNIPIEEVEASILEARDTGGTLNIQDASRLLSENKARSVGGTPTSAGRDTLLSILKLDDHLDLKNNATTASNATIEFDTEIEELVKREGRNPSRMEAIEIGRKVAKGYLLSSGFVYAATFPKPTSAPESWKTRTTQMTKESLDEVYEANDAIFRKIHENNNASMAIDREYIKQKNLILRWRETTLPAIEAKEERNRAKEGSVK